MADYNSEKMDESQLKQLIDSEINQAKDYGWAIKEQREESMRYYYGMPFGNEVEGRSSIVLHEVQDVVEWIMPQLMRIFTSGDQFGKFEPESEEDIKEAEQATDYCNYIYMRRNKGFENTYDSCKDGLIAKTGVQKIWWDESEKKRTDTYTGLNDISFRKLLMDPEVEVLEHEERQISMQMLESEEDFGQGSEPGEMVEMSDDGSLLVHDLKIETRTSKGRVRIEVVPPEEFYVTNRAKSLDPDDAPFIAHRTEMTVQEMIEMNWNGITRDRLLQISGDDDQEYDIELIARFSKDETYTSVDIQDSAEPLMRRVWVTEAYLFADWDGDGVAEYRKVTKAGDVILDNVEVDEHPFVSICPIRIPHKYYGLSLADVVMDLQLIKSTIFRNILDNAYLQNNQRSAVDAGKVNLDDLLTSRPHGIVRVQGDPRTRMMPIITPPLPESTFIVLDAIDKIRDQRTGVNQFMQGIDPEVLQKTTLGAFEKASSMAQSRIELIARIYAETGFKDCYLKIYSLIIKHQDRMETFKLRGKWQTVDPTRWHERSDFTIQVGLGHGTREQNLAMLEKLGTGLSNLRGDPELKVMVTPKNVYNYFVKLMDNMGFKNVDELMTDPDTVKPTKPQQGDPAAMQKAQADLMKAQATMEKVKLEREKLAFEKQKMQVESQRDGLDFQLELERFEWEKKETMMEDRINQAKLVLEEKELQVEYLTNRAVAIGDT